LRIFGEYQWSGGAARYSPIGIKQGAGFPRLGDIDLIAAYSSDMILLLDDIVTKIGGFVLRSGFSLADLENAPNLRGAEASPIEIGDSINPHSPARRVKFRRPEFDIDIVIVNLVDGQTLSEWVERRFDFDICANLVSVDLKSAFFANPSAILDHKATLNPTGTCGVPLAAHRWRRFIKNCRRWHGDTAVAILCRWGVRGCCAASIHRRVVKYLDRGFRIDLPRPYSNR
jgi:hypothetical protein